MNEQREAEALARWLDSRGGEPPEEVGDDVLEAALALRPDLAPPPRVSIDDVLGEVLDGPLASDLGESARLASWLDEDQIPDDADDEALEAIFALRPDLAAPPRVSLDDVLAGLQSGPFGERSSANPEPTLPASLGELPETVVVANNVPGSGRRLPVWFLPGVGALLAAALALVVVVPMGAQLRSGFPQVARESEMPRPATAPVAEAMQPPPSMGPMEEKTVALEASPAEPPADGPSLGARGDAGLDQGAVGGLVAQPAAQPTSAPEFLGKAAPANEKQDERLKDATTSTGSTVIDLAPLAEGRSYQEAASPGAGAPSETIPEAATLASSGYVNDDAEEEWSNASPARTEAAEAEVSEDADELVASKRTTSTRDTRGGAKPKASAATTQTAAASAPPPATASDSWSQSANRRQQADAALARGDVDTAEAILEVLARDPDPSVAAQAALDLGRLLLNQRREAEALVVVRHALALSGVPRELTLKLRALQEEIAQ